MNKPAPLPEVEISFVEGEKYDDALCGALELLVKYYVEASCQGKSSEEKGDIAGKICERLFEKQLKNM